MQWNYSLDQKYFCDSTILVTSGCSFTSSTTQLATAASWPGYVLDRCRFDHCIDYSYPGAGNDFIGDSILHHFKDVVDSDLSNYFVIVMWSGIDRVESKILNPLEQPNLGGVCYRRLLKTEYSAGVESEQAQRSYNKILEIYRYLTDRKINFAFTFYSNLLFPPYIPKRDTTREFDYWLNQPQLDTLKKLSWMPTEPMDFLYEYSWRNDYLNNGDHFHPTSNASLSWTDDILLPCMQKQNLITAL